MGPTCDGAAYPGDVRAYAVYGAAVVAPCAGSVAAVSDGLPDLPPGAMDPEHPAGNHVVLHCGETSVLLAHLSPGSVAVAEGDEASTGDEVGRVGNTGNTSEPHLHVHVVRGRWRDIDDVAYQAEPVAMLFDGRFLVRGDTVDGASSSGTR